MRLTLIEVMISACVLSLIAIILFATVNRRNKYSQTECRYNLKMLYTSYANFVLDHGKFVTQVSTNEGGTMELANMTDASIHFRALLSDEAPSNFVDFVVCPLDKSVRATTWQNLARTNLSYFLSLNPPTESEHWILSGNRNIRFVNRPYKVDWDSSLGLHGEFGHLLFLDGSVTAVDNMGLSKFSEYGGNATNRVAIP